MVCEDDELHAVPVSPVYSRVGKTATRVEVYYVVRLGDGVPHAFGGGKAISYAV